LVRQSAKRMTVPDVLELAELQLLLSKLDVRERTLALLDAATGLRASELLALRWRDVDFENLELRVTRSIWHQVVGDCKTEASAKPVPIDSYMAEDLLRWRVTVPKSERPGAPSRGWKTTPESVPPAKDSVDNVPTNRYVSYQPDGI